MIPKYFICIIFISFFLVKPVLLADGPRFGAGFVKAQENHGKLNSGYGINLCLDTATFSKFFFNFSSGFWKSNSIKGGGIYDEISRAGRYSIGYIDISILFAPLTSSSNESKLILYLGPGLSITYQDFELDLLNTSYILKDPDIQGFGVKMTNRNYNTYHLRFGLSKGLTKNSYLNIDIKYLPIKLEFDQWRFDINGYSFGFDATHEYDLLFLTIGILINL